MKLNESQHEGLDRKPEVSKAWRLLVSFEKFVGFVLTFLVILIAFCIALLVTCNAVGIQDDVDAAMSALLLPRRVALALFALPIILIPGGPTWWEIYVRRPKKEKDES